MHYREFRAAKKVGRAAETVQHTGTHDAGGICVAVDVDFDGGVHADHTQATDDLRGVGDLLRTQEDFIVVS